MKYFFDTEFIEDGKTIELLSIGVVAEDGRELYLENREANLSKANDWVKEHVFTQMLWTLKVQVSREYIAQALLYFVNEIPIEDVDQLGMAGISQLITPKDKKPEFWAYFADYDWVILCQLYGRMIDLPENWPMYCRDFKQLLDTEAPGARLNKLPESDAHNALGDARWLKREFERMQ